MLPTQQEALAFPHGEIALGFCKECGFISNVAFNPSMLDYSSAYEDQQVFSSTFNAFAYNLAKRLIGKYQLYNKNILEIGCGKGDFLMLLCELGNNSGVGIDPAYVEGRVQSEASNKVKFIRDYYSRRYADYYGDFVCCRHTLEHIYNTKDFVDCVRSSVGSRLDTIVFFEVPDVIRVLRELAFWDIYYEHCSYFSPGSLARLFRLCNFEVTELSRDFNDQYLLIEVKPVSQPSEKVHDLEENVETIAKLVKYFSSNCDKKLQQWKSRLQKNYKNGKRIVIWGSGSKCVSFMSTLGISDEIEYVVDINPYRQGNFLPGSGKKVMPPEFLKEKTPDLIIIMNPVYREEIMQMLNRMEVSTDVIQLE
jgi:SAM-dependent methyltransferase